MRGGFASSRLSIGTLAKACSEVSAKGQPNAHCDFVGDVVGDVGREVKPVCWVVVSDRAWESVADVCVQIVHGEPLVRAPLRPSYVHGAPLAIVLPQEVGVADGLVPENRERGLPHHVGRAVFPRAHCCHVRAESVGAVQPLRAAAAAAWQTPQPVEMPDDVGMRWSPLAPCLCVCLIRPELGFSKLRAAVGPSIGAHQPRSLALRTEEVQGDDEALAAVHFVDEHPLIVLPRVAVSGIRRLCDVLLGGCRVLAAWCATGVVCVVSFDAVVNVLPDPLVDDFARVGVSCQDDPRTRGTGRLIVV